MAPNEKKIRKGYKQTELGVVPEDWDVKEMENFTLSVASGKSNTTNELGDYPIYGSTGIIGYRKQPDYSGDKVLIARVGANAGTVNKVSGKYCVSDNTLMVIYQSGIDINFSYYQLINFKLNKLVFGSGQPLITGSQIKKIAFAIPKNKPEQTAIATVLSDTDMLIERLEKLIAKKKAIKQGTMQQLLTGKKRLPGFSREWEVKKLEEIVDFSNGKAHENFISDDGDYIVVNSKFISSEGQVIKYSKQCFCPAPANSILLVMSDVPNGKAIAKCFLVDKNDKYTVNQRICVLNPKIDAKFLFYKINRNPYYLAFDDGVKQTNLRKDDVLGCKLSIPKEKLEQTAIATILSDMDTEIESLEQKQEKYIMLKQGIMQQLLTGKIRIYANN